MFTNDRKRYGSGIARVAAACALIVASHAGAVDTVRAEALASEGAPVERLSLAELEKAFWICDYRAITHGVESTPVALCTAVYDAVKEQKFGGDFSELLAWWREKRDVEHGVLAGGE